MPDEEAFVQEFDSMLDVHNVCIDDSLAQHRDRFMCGVADSVMIDRSANLQTRDGFRTRKQAYVNVIAVVLIVDTRATQVGTNGVARSVLRYVVQIESSRWDFPCNGKPHSLRGQESSVIGKLHDQRTVRRGLKPAPAVEVVVANPGVITTERQF